MSLTSLLKRSVKATRKASWKGTSRDPGYDPLDLLANTGVQARRPFDLEEGRMAASMSWKIQVRKCNLRRHPAFPRARRAA